MLDEPSAGLDATSAKELYRTVSRLCAEGVTVLMVSHELQTVLEEATHILHVGEPCFFGTKEEYRARFFDSDRKEDADGGLV